MREGLESARRLRDALAASDELRAEFAASFPDDLALADLDDRAAGRPLRSSDPDRLDELRREVYRRRDEAAPDEGDADAVARLREAESELADRTERLDGLVLRALVEVDARAAAAAASAEGGTEVLESGLADGRPPVTAFGEGGAGASSTRPHGEDDDDLRARRRGPLLVVIAVVVFALLAAGGVVVYGQWRAVNPVTQADPSPRTASPTPTASPTGDPTPAPTPTPTRTPSCVSSTPAPSGAESVGGLALQTPRDSGSSRYATGSLTLDAAGVPIAYTVAPGDIGGFVANRLCLDFTYLTLINSVRRDGLIDLYAGDVINLEPHSVLITGTQLGEALANDVSHLVLPVQTQPYVEPAPTNWLPVADSGPTEFAAGEAVLRNGELVGYRVVADDELGYIAARFGTTRSQLIELNCPRRGQDGVLFVGDIINLNPATVYTVGARNGINVRTNGCPFSFPLPEQR